MQESLLRRYQAGSRGARRSGAVQRLDRARPGFDPVSRSQVRQLFVVGQPQFIAGPMKPCWDGISGQVGVFRYGWAKSP
jgi:hypothetical protein